MRIAVTGASGFLGSYTVNYLLKNGHTLSLFDRKRHSLEDIDTLKSLLEDVDAVVHLAGSNRASPMDLLQINTLGTQVLLSAIEKYRRRVKLVFASSFQVYTKHSHYALSKLFAEELISLASHQQVVHAVILRFSNLYGPGAKPDYNSVIATFADRIKRRCPIYISGDGSQKRDYLFVTDAAAAIEKAITCHQMRNCDVFDICSGEQVSLNDVIKTFQKYVDHDITASYKMGDKQAEWVTSRRTYRKASEALHWSPLVSLDEGIRRMVGHDKA